MESFDVSLQMLQFMQVPLHKEWSVLIITKIKNKDMSNIKITIVTGSKPLANGDYKLYLRITKNREKKDINIVVRCKFMHFDSVREELTKNHPNYRDDNEFIINRKNKANEIVRGFQLEDYDFTLNEFEEEFRGVKKTDMTVAEFWKELIGDLITEGRTGNARAYKDTYNSFFKFHKNKSLKFSQLNYNLLDKYETYLRANNNQDGGIGVKMRAIRALFNYAIKKGVTDKRHYPFEVYKVSRFKSNNTKKALSREEFGKMENLDTSNLPTLIHSHNYMVFSYYTGGMNFVDVMKLKWSNIQGDRIEYKRSKTKGNFTIKISAPIQKILDFYSKHNGVTDYVFPILLSNDLTPTQIENRKSKCLGRYNNDLKKIAELQGVDKKVSSYTIRHTFATNLKFAGISTDKISELMGHHDVSITRAYLKPFEKEILDDAMDMLLPKSNDLKK